MASTSMPSTPARPDGRHMASLAVPSQWPASRYEPPVPPASRRRVPQVPFARPPVRALPPAHVPRPRLIQALAAAPVGLVEAPGGFGKSVLAAELAAALDLPELEADLVGTVSTPSLLVAALRRGAARSGLSDLATALQRVVDEIGRASW